MKTLPLLCSLAAIALTGLPAAAQYSPSAADQAVAQYVISDSQAEIALSRLALEKTQSPAVRSFAQRMISDHTNAIAQTVLLVKAQNLGPMEMKPSEEGVIELNHFSRYSGHLFDENFLQHNQEDHLNDIATLRHAAEITKNATVKAFENQQLTLLETHLLLVEQTMDQVAQSE